MKSLLDHWLQRTPGSRAFAQYLFLWSAWPDIVGSRLAEHCAPYKVDGATLEVYVDEGTVASMLQYALPRITEAIRKWLPDAKPLTHLKTRRWQGSYPLKELTMPRVKPPVADPPDFGTLLAGLSESQHEQLFAGLQNVTDLEMKEKLLQTWVLGLSRTLNRSGSEHVDGKPAGDLGIEER